MLKALTTTWTGIRPLIMHNGLLCDPLSPVVKAMKAITSKRKKTDADYLELERQEFLGSLYTYDKGVHIPTANIERCIQLGAQKSKQGKAAQAAIFVSDPIVPLLYKGTRTPETLEADPAFSIRVPIKVGLARIMRRRPMFSGWSLKINLEFDDEVLNASDIEGFMVTAGALIGLGDWRPKFGRFTVA